MILGATLDGKQLIVEFTRGARANAPPSEVPGIRNKIIKKNKDRSDFGFNRRRSSGERGRGRRGGFRGRRGAQKD
jgi:hypothetical protein